MFALRCLAEEIKVSPFQPLLGCLRAASGESRTAPDDASHVADQRRFIEIAAELDNGGHLILTTQNRTVNLRNSRIKAPAEGQLRRWRTKKDLRALLSPRFECLQLFTIEPSGDLGFLRIVNSRMLNAALTRVFSEQRVIRNGKVR